MAPSFVKYFSEKEVKKIYSSTPCFFSKNHAKTSPGSKKVNRIKENSTFSANLARKIGSMGTKMGLLGLKIGLMYIKKQYLCLRPEKALCLTLYRRNGSQETERNVELQRRHLHSSFSVNSPGHTEAPLRCRTRGRLRLKTDLAHSYWSGQN